MSPLKLVVITGISGSGKSTAIKALEDIGFFCVDNLPIKLLEGFLNLCREQEDLKKVALVVDVRERAFLSGLEDVVAGLSERDVDVDLVFLESKDDVLLRRFSVTRRKHPLSGPSIATSEAIQRERDILAELKSRADWVIDTSSMTVHELKRMIQNAYSDSRNGNELRVTVMSFSYSRGLPDEADYIFDCRFLPNPYFVESLRGHTGLDQDVRDYVFQTDDARMMLEKVVDYLLMVLPWHIQEGRPAVTVAFGCTGGRHRSVSMAVKVADTLRSGGVNVNIVHRDIPTEQE